MKGGPAVHPQGGIIGGEARPVLRRAVTERATLFDRPDPEREAQADARAEADVREGRLVSHDAVKKWLSSWGSERRLPRPRVGD